MTNELAVAAAPMMIPGLDAGFPQGELTAPQWVTIRRDRSWAFLRCESGTGPNIDGTFRTNLDGARAAAMLGVGAYCVFLPGEDPVKQATAWFTGTGGLGTRLGELPPAIDFEIASKTLTPAEELASLISVIHAMIVVWGRAVVLYTYPDFWKRIVPIATPEELTVLAGCLLWYASYANTPPAPPAPWKVVSFWQSSGGTKYRTPNGAECDADFFLGTEAELVALASFEVDVGPNPLAGAPFPLDIPGENT